jgi:hypothetical protein
VVEQVREDEGGRLMADEQAGTSAPTEGGPDLGWHPPGANPSAPGWYPSGSNPNEQAYWDGQHWTRERHWSVNGWAEEDVATRAGHAAGAAAAPRLSANPYSSQPAHARPRSGPTNVSLGVLLMMASAIALMYGSVNSWVRVTGSVAGVAVLHVSVNGTDPAVTTLIGVNGYVTFIGGIVLLVFAGLALTNNDMLLAVLTAVVAAVVLVFAIYDMFRIVQKISQVTTSGGSSVSVGWGLITVLSGAVLAFVIALLRLASR